MPEAGEEFLQVLTNKFLLLDVVVGCDLKFWASRRQLGARSGPAHHDFIQAMAAQDFVWRQDFGAEEPPCQNRICVVRSWKHNLWQRKHRSV